MIIIRKDFSYLTMFIHYNLNPIQTNLVLVCNHIRFTCVIEKNESNT